MSDICGGGFAFRCCSKFRTEPFCSMLQKGFDFMKNRISTKKICTLGLLTAITVTLGVFATFRVGNLMKIPMKFITVFTLFDHTLFSEQSILTWVVSAIYLAAGVGFYILGRFQYLKREDAE